LFEAPTVADLAARLGLARPASIPLEPKVRPERIPLSFAQQRLWFLNRMEGPSPTYNIIIALRLTGTLDTDALAAALYDLVARHESLRTLFPETDETPYQQILAPEGARERMGLEAIRSPRCLPPHDLTSALQERAHEGFDLARQIPLRAHLLRLEKELDSSQSLGSDPTQADSPQPLELRPA